MRPRQEMNLVLPITQSDQSLFYPGSDLFHIDECPGHSNN